MKRRKKRKSNVRWQRSGEGGNRMNERLAAHLIMRLRREATALAFSDAVEAGVLRREDVESDGRVLRVYRRDQEAGGAMSASQVAGVLSRHRRWPSTESRRPVPGSPDLPLEPVAQAPETQARDSRSAALHFARSQKPHPTDDLTIVRALRAAAEPPRASDVATVLLLAQSVRDDQPALASVLQVLKLRRPIVALLCEVQGFERSFLSLLKRGVLLPSVAAISNGYDAIDALRFNRAADARWRVVAFAGQDYEDDCERQFGIAARSDFPILAVAEKAERLAAKLVNASQLVLECGTLSARIACRTIETVLGAVPTDGKLDGINFQLLDLGDLALAIRPGITADAAVETLRRLAEAAGDAAQGTETRNGKPPKDERSKSASSSTDRKGDPASGSDIIEPVPPSEIGGAQRVPTVESLAGYGEAGAWALQIRDSLPLWRAGKLAWAEMSTKVLLSGPPGVGKTLFARALCNSLQIPLLATSVARWLEPSHLGDVLKRVRRAFAEAEAQKPCILFIDEFDGIGRRVPFETREYADYWNSFVNCGLEMLDGAARTAGVVIVCATNDPSAIDTALLRSGRIDRQIEIPLPDAEARLSILKHHLGDDVDGILAKAAKTAGKADLHRMLREGMEMISDQPYRDLVAAAIPSRAEVDAA
ncbi:ATP-binding protein [Mesorhizobium sp. VK23B]|uniref:ATP-binding protein n=1 Tax=Mesorhizobium dulcispinae TaxID=3072316 RepID=A0ABU4XBI4_9HYPH|nr:MULTISPECIES: ATP-binding protein [unclassified Mesorhizobium]MDX8465652.1 ATP-binding protein [Mesorhizobium sp. VK23B]MDX8471546.1 ATP-binding protein [Mesorhizobium sp. VK23A]